MTHKAGNGTVFHYNSDFSGLVTIVIPDQESQESQVVKVNGSDILELVASGYLLPKRVIHIENMDWRELLAT